MVGPGATSPVPAAAAGARLAGPARTPEAGAVLVFAGVGDDAPEAAELRLAGGPSIERAAGVPSQCVRPVTPHTEPRDFNDLVAVERAGERLSDRHHA